MDYIFVAVIILGGIALVAALVLYKCSKAFAVNEDPRLAQVAAELPNANCGGCGYAGCAGMAAALVKGADKGSIAGLSCPVGGAEVMGRVADLLGMSASQTAPKVAVVRCGGTPQKRPAVAVYSGMRTCGVMNLCGAGETACGFGCLGCGDCVAACQFGGIKMNADTRLPEIDERRCTGCGACARTCPRNIIELRDKGVNNRRVYVGCVNKDKGPTAMRACKAACIGCGKCAKTCEYGAISIANNVAYINDAKCRLCRKCEEACPTHAIVATHFPEAEVSTPIINN